MFSTTLNAEYGMLEQMGLSDEEIVRVAEAASRSLSSAGGQKRPCCKLPRPSRGAGPAIMPP